MIFLEAKFDAIKKNEEWKKVRKWVTTFSWGLKMVDDLTIAYTPAHGSVQNIRIKKIIFVLRTVPCTQ